MSLQERGRTAQTIIAGEEGSSQVTDLTAEAGRIEHLLVGMVDVIGNNIQVINMTFFVLFSSNIIYFDFINYPKLSCNLERSLRTIYPVL